MKNKTVTFESTSTPFNEINVFCIERDLEGETFAHSYIFSVEELAETLVQPNVALKTMIKKVAKKIASASQDVVEEDLQFTRCVSSTLHFDFKFVRLSFEFTRGNKTNDRDVQFSVEALNTDVNPEVLADLIEPIVEIEIHNPRDLARVVRRVFEADFAIFCLNEDEEEETTSDRCECCGKIPAWGVETEDDDPCRC
jgi:hypothetical protein